MREHCFRVCTMEHGDTGTWGKAAKSKDRLYVSQGALKAAHDMLQGKASVHDLVDFEDHCLDPTTDWFSPTVQLPATSLTPPTS